MIGDFTDSSLAVVVFRLCDLEKMMRASPLRNGHKERDGAKHQIPKKQPQENYHPKYQVPKKQLQEIKIIHSTRRPTNLSTIKKISQTA